MSPVGAKRVSKPHYHGGKLISSNAVGIESGGEEEPVHVENASRHHVYVFGNGEDLYEVEPSAIELNELRPRKGLRGDQNQDDGFKNQSSAITRNQFIERQVTDGDTISSVALKYGCTVLELKQANNIYNNQDFFALKTVKIPVHKFSSLLDDGPQENHCTKPKKKRPTGKALRANVTEIIDSDEIEIYSKAPTELLPEDSDISRDSQDSVETCTSDLTRTISIGRSLNGSEEDITDFLTHMDKDIMKICNKVQTKKENLDEVINTLTVKCVHPLYSSEKVTKQPQLGAIGGITWKGILVAMCILAVLCPIIIILYFKVYKKR